MTAIDTNSKEHLDFCYKEYTRVAAIMETQLKSAMDDFKMLGAVGSILAWKPIQSTFIEVDSPQWLLVGFVVLLFITLIIVLFNFMKQSVALFYADQMKYYEAEIRRLTDAQEQSIFSGVKHWTRWMEKIQEPLVARFFGLFLGFVLLFPTVMLIMTEPKNLMYSGIYFVIALIAIGLVSQALNTITRKITAVLKQEINTP